MRNKIVVGMESENMCLESMLIESLVKLPAEYVTMGWEDKVIQAEGRRRGYEMIFAMLRCNQRLEVFESRNISRGTRLRRMRAR